MGNNCCMQDTFGITAELPACTWQQHPRSQHGDFWPPWPSHGGAYTTVQRTGVEGPPRGYVWHGGCGPGTYGCQWQGDAMQPVVAGMQPQNQTPQGFGMGGQECRAALPCSRPFPSQSVLSLPPPPQQGPGSSHPYRCVCFFV